MTRAINNVPVVVDIAKEMLFFAEQSVGKAEVAGAENVNYWQTGVVFKVETKQNR
jgi:hypothetical protein